MPDSQELNVGLAMSGGGFRATLFHLGSLWRLNELGCLRQLDIITSVSGGSIIAGLLAYNWNELTWQQESQGEVAINFREAIEAPLRNLCSRPIDLQAGLVGILSPFSSMSDELARAYDRYLFHGRTLQQLPEAEPGKTPRFIFYATSLQTGSGVRISRKYLADYKVGRIDHPDFRLSKVVTASSAFPPLFSPVIFRIADVSVWKPMPGTYLHDRFTFKNRLFLADGGVYDNMGLEAVWDRCKTLLVSDAGSPMEMEKRPAANPIGQLGRVRNILINQTRALRKRKLVDDFKDGVRHGTYWGITTEIGHYELPDPLTQDSDRTQQLQKIRTRLNKFSAEEQGLLINWGYALADAALRRHCPALLPAIVPAPAWPCPEYALG